MTHKSYNSIINHLSVLQELSDVIINCHIDIYVTDCYHMPIIQKALLKALNCKGVVKICKLILDYTFIGGGCRVTI